MQSLSIITLYLLHVFHQLWVADIPHTTWLTDWLPLKNKTQLEAALNWNTDWAFMFCQQTANKRRRPVWFFSDHVVDLREWESREENICSFWPFIEFLGVFSALASPMMVLIPTSSSSRPRNPHCCCSANTHTHTQMMSSLAHLVYLLMTDHTAPGCEPPRWTQAG